MNQARTFRINVPTLFEMVNEHRRERGLPAVEPAVMGVRASIKFAIRQHKHIGLKGEVEMDESDANALAAALEELFNVNLHPDDWIATKTDLIAQKPATSQPDDKASDHEEEGRYALPIYQFYAAINQARRAQLLQPIEPAVISVRTGVKFSIVRRRQLDIRGNELLLSPRDLEALGTIVSQQFGVEIPGGLLSLCQSPAPQMPAKKTALDQASAPKSFLARLLGRLMGRQRGMTAGPSIGRDVHHYTIDTSALLLAIISRRAYLGHRAIRPAMVKKRFGQILSAELELEVDLDKAKIDLMPEQIDAFAGAIRKEFEIMFEDLDDLLGKGLDTKKIEEQRVLK
jgi:hypothetical protein